MAAEATAQPSWPKLPGVCPKLSSAQRGSFWAKWGTSLSTVTGNQSPPLAGSGDDFCDHPRTHHAAVPRATKATTMSKGRSPRMAENKTRKPAQAKSFFRIREAKRALPPGPPLTMLGRP